MRRARQLATDTHNFVFRVTGNDHFPKRMNYRRVGLLIQLGHTRVVAIHREHVLGQVVGAHRQEIDPPGQLPGLVHGGRDLDHHTDLRPVDHEPFLGDFGVSAVHQFLRLIHLADVGDHRQHDAQFALETGVRFDHCAHLRHEDLGVVEGDADSAPA